jgi:hypothetical protein
MLSAERFEIRTTTMLRAIETTPPAASFNPSSISFMV